jgi:hypothetical protein
MLTGLLVGSPAHRQLAHFTSSTTSLVLRCIFLFAVISAATYQLIQGYCLSHDCGTQTLRDVATPLRVYRVLGESGAQSRLDIAATNNSRNFCASTVGCSATWWGISALSRLSGCPRAA